MEPIGIAPDAGEPPVIGRNSHEERRLAILRNASGDAFAEGDAGRPTDIQRQTFRVRDRQRTGRVRDHERGVVGLERLHRGLDDQLREILRVVHAEDRRGGAIERRRPLQPAAVDGVAERGDQRLGRNRFLQQVEDARAQARNRGLQLRVGGHDHHLGADSSVSRRAKHFPAVQIGHLHVEEHYVHVALLELLDAFAASCRLFHRVTGVRELVANDGPEVVVVVDHQHAGRGRGGHLL